VYSFSYHIWKRVNRFAESFFAFSYSFSSYAFIFISYMKTSQSFCWIVFYIQLFRFPCALIFISYIKTNQSICWIVFLIQLILWLYIICMCLDVYTNRYKKKNLFVWKYRLYICDGLNYVSFYLVFSNYFSLITYRCIFLRFHQDSLEKLRNNAFSSLISYHQFDIDVDHHAVISYSFIFIHFNLDHTVSNQFFCFLHLFL